MIPLKINKNHIKVPKISELSTQKYLDLINLGDFDLIDYLSLVLDMSKSDTEKVRVKNPTFLSWQLFGKLPDYTKQKAKKRIVLNGREYRLNSNFTLGQRFLIEEEGKIYQDTELAIFILAVTADQESYKNLIPLIKNSPASEILPEAFFLSKNLLIGKNSGLRYLAKFLRMIKIKI